MIYYIGHQELFPDGYPKGIVPLSVEGAIEGLEQYFHAKDYIYFDTESTGLDPHTAKLTCYQLGDDKHQFFIDETVLPIKKIKHLLESKTLVIHNAKHDLKFLYHQRIVPSKVFDTYLAEAVLFTGIIEVRRSLEACLLRRFNIQLDKAIRDSFIGRGITSMKQVVYACEDVSYLGRLMRAQVSDLLRQQLDRTIDLENKFVRSLAYIEYCGLGFSTTMWSKKSQEDLEDLDKRRKELDADVIALGDNRFISRTLFGTECKVSWSSPAQVQKLLKSLGVETSTVDKKTGKSKESVTAALIESQRDKHPIVGKYIDYKQAEKLYTSYGKSFLENVNPATGRIHSSFSQIQDTGRLASREPNVQNIPADKRHRSCFVPEEGNKMVSGDYSSQESRVLVEFSQEPNLVRFYLSGEADLHSYTAKLVYAELKNTPINEIKKKFPDKRNLMKTVNFGLAYGGTAETIAANANISMEDAKRVYEDYFKAFPDLGRYFIECRAQPKRDGFVFINNTSKRKSFIHAFSEYEELARIIRQDGFWERYRADAEFKAQNKDLVSRYFKIQGAIERKGLNYPIQGTSADMSKLAAVYLFEALIKNNHLFIVSIVNAVHDEINMETPEDLADYYKVVLKQCMEKAGSVFCKTIPILAEVDTADCWQK